MSIKGFIKRLGQRRTSRDDQLSNKENKTFDRDKKRHQSERISSRHHLLQEDVIRQRHQSERSSLTLDRQLEVAVRPSATLRCLSNSHIPVENATGVQYDLKPSDEVEETHTIPPARFGSTEILQYELWLPQLPQYLHNM